MPAWRYFEGGGKRAVLVWHRRAGKDDLALHLAAVKSMERTANYWHMLPEAAQARKAIWEAVNPHTGTRRIDEAFPKDIRETTRENEMMIRFRNGSTWQVVGSDNYNSLVGSPPAGVVFSEYALADPQAWAYISPILDENGGWAAFISTPRGENHLKRLYEYANERDGWFGERLTADATGIFTVDQLNDRRREYIQTFGPEMGRALFDQEYLCSFQSAILGAYYGGAMRDAERDGRICSVPHDKAADVWAAWDLGIGDSTAIWIGQAVGREIHLIDYIENSGQGLDWYVAELNSRPYRVDNHLLPHDADARELISGRTRREYLEGRGLNCRIVPMHTVEDGINGVRMALNRCVFDAKRCERGIAALRMYRTEWDDKRQTLKPHPVHDWSSHGADAMRYFIMGLDERPNAKAWGKPDRSWVV